MQRIDSSQLIRAITLDYLKENIDSSVTFGACVHKIKKSFVMLRTGRYVLQGIYNKKLCEQDLSELREGAYITLNGIVRNEPRAEHGFEIDITAFEVLSKPHEEYPLMVSSKTMECDTEATLEHRSVALRHPDLRAVFKLREGVTRAFSEFMLANNFTEIHTPRLTAMEADNAFMIDYFGSDAYLSQSNALYRQMCIAFFDRVFEITHVFTALKRSSMRHLNEYVCLDYEAGFINDVHDIMAMHTALMKFIIKYLNENYEYELNLLDIALPVINDIPVITLDEALKILNKPSQPDLDPTDMVKLSKYIKESYSSDFVFVEQIKKCPFYVKDTNSFILIFDGLDVAFVSQNILEYDEIKNSGIDEKRYSSFLEAHKYGLPPHGGASINLERLLMKLTGSTNIREVSLFPRDMRHIEP